MISDNVRQIIINFEIFNKLQCGHGKYRLTILIIMALLVTKAIIINIVRGIFPAATLYKRFIIFFWLDYVHIRV